MKPPPTTTTRAHLDWPCVELHNYGCLPPKPSWPNATVKILYSVQEYRLLAILKYLKVNFLLLSSTLLHCFHEALTKTHNSPNPPGECTDSCRSTVSHKAKLQRRNATKFNWIIKNWFYYFFQIFNLNNYRYSVCTNKNLSHLLLLSMQRRKKMNRFLYQCDRGILTGLRHFLFDVKASKEWPNCLLGGKSTSAFKIMWWSQKNSNICLGNVVEWKSYVSQKTNVQKKSLKKRT